MTGRQKVLVTGGAGFIGSHLVEFLKMQGKDVVCLLMAGESDRWTSRLDITRVRGDITNKTSLYAALEGVSTVYHLAAKMGGWSSPEYLHEVNVTGSKNLIEICRETKLALKRFLFVSSMAAAGSTGPTGVFDENRPPHPANLYGRSKLLFEEYLRTCADDIPFTTVRLPLVYGPRSVRGLPAVLKMVNKGLHLTSTQSSFMVGFVEDIVGGLVLAAEHPSGVSETFYLGEGRIYTTSEIIDQALNILDRKALKLSVPYFALYGFAALAEGVASVNKSNAFLRKHYVRDYFKSHWRYTPAKAEKILGYETKFPLALGLKITIDWYKQNGWLK